ncbi:MAG: hypothetical protein RIC80_20270, partial [Cyclobacteriaceae bacterium]
MQLTKALFLIALSLFSVTLKAQAPTDAEWQNYFSNFKAAVATANPESLWDYMLYPIPGNGVDQQTFDANYDTYFPQEARTAIAAFENQNLELVNNYLSEPTNDGKLIKMELNTSNFPSTYFF